MQAKESRNTTIRVKGLKVNRVSLSRRRTICHPNGVCTRPQPRERDRCESLVASISDYFSRQELSYTANVFAAMAHGHRLWAQSLHSKHQRAKDKWDFWILENAHIADCDMVLLHTVERVLRSSALAFLVAMPTWVASYNHADIWRV